MTAPRNQARILRNNPTEAEVRLWRALSARKVARVRFNRQVPVGAYICDFVARSIGLVIEVDGGQHDSAEDARRTEVLAARGFRVIRFWNNDVLSNLEGVVAEIERVLAERPSPNPSRPAGGEQEVHQTPLPLAGGAGGGFGATNSAASRE
ncbi:endonuclease domain-containing protein [Microvirga sp. SRT01]|uniref:Endonuclease domain-containing protein n=1 Tax=Sphingomonas longa TaxID=2778730 RepID=A0ABS2D365_9SPHN|nr:MULTISPECIES: endonuclease domain-containing protein [Alphaproteobacteria]MBM6575367.1 endonuclease domain-containing protein [Sphingomonas sp. BT552]MBR7708416.1 endonuclease domain-containing protein [Microvirga sp. SRT01]